MTQVATVEKLLADGKAEITVARQSACAHDCSECAGCGTAASPVRAVAVNAVGARAGQKVIVESDTTKVFGAILLVYMLPLALFLVGYFASAALGSDSLRAVIGIGAFLCGLVPAVVYDRRLRRRGGLAFTIVKIF